jgi:plastocyanin
MNSKLFLFIAVLVVLLGGFFLLGNKSNNNQVNQNQQTTQSQNQASANPAEPTTTSVSVTNNGFEPQTITIKAGQTVVWTNKSGGTVTVNSDAHPTHLLFPFLNLGEFSDGSSTSVVVEKPGTYTYHNHLNPSQKGTIIAQ